MKNHRSHRQGGLASPKPSGVGGFTLIEIMIVVLIVGILSWLAMVAVARIRDRAARTVIANNLRQLYNAKEFYYSETGSTDPMDVPTLAGKGYVTPGLNARLFAQPSLEVGAGWHYNRVFLPNQPTFAYQGALPANSAPTGDVIYYPGPPSDYTALFGKNAVAPALPPSPPALGKVSLMRSITGATALSAFSGAQSGVPLGTKLVGLYMAGSDVNQLGGVDPSHLPAVSGSYTAVGNAGYQYLDQSGALGRLMPTMADHLHPLSPSERNAWDGGIAVFSDGSVARMLKACNGNSGSGEKDYVYFSKLDGVNAQQGMAVVRGTSAPSQSVQVMDGATVLATVKADAQGNWNFAGPASLAGGSSSLSVVPVPVSP